MGDLTANFSRWEMECRCGCGLCNMQEEFMERLQAMRLYYGAPMPINSAARCPAYNAKVGGKPGSAHPDGWAVDVGHASGREQAELHAAGVKAGFNRFGPARTFLHVDCHPDKYPHVMWGY